jgi:hypothetical protein
MMSDLWPLTFDTNITGHTPVKYSRRTYLMQMDSCAIDSSSPHLTVGIARQDVWGLRKTVSIGVRLGLALGI